MKPQQTVCPCCGGKIKGSGLIVDLNLNTVVLGDRGVRIDAQTAEFLFIINKSFPSSASFEQIESAMYGGGDRPSDPRKTIYVIAMKARYAGNQIGFRLENISGVGYRLLLGANGKDYR